MTTPLKQSANRKNLRLLPQEKEGTYRFNRPFVTTTAAIGRFGQCVIAEAYAILQSRVKKKGGLDYLQVFEVDGERLWFIDDVTHVTCLLPQDY